MSDSKPMSDSSPDSPVAACVHPSPNHGERKVCQKTGSTAPDSIILHYTGMPSASEALLWLANPISQVSCHYFVFEDGRIWQMVPENRRAWHAGKSSWHGETDMNSRSIGIEIANAGHDLSKAFASESLSPAKAGMGTGSREANASKRMTMPPEPGAYPDFPEAQIEAVIALVADIKARWAIPDARILAHSDIAPGRKVDPGEKFPWAQLAAAGLGLWIGEENTIPSLRGAQRRGNPDSLATAKKPAKGWIAASALPPRNDGVREGPTYRPGDEGLPVAALQSMFAKFGYGIEITGVYDAKTVDVVAAFQRHWRQARVDGVADGETLGLLRALMVRAKTF